MKKIVVLYHKDCPDGFSAAWVAWKKFGDNADYIPIVHQMPPLDDLVNKNIYMIDIAYPKDVLDDLLSEGNKIVILDHHESIADVVRGMGGSVYDANHSGAVIAWKYFFPDKSVPKLLEYVEDMDLWHLQLPHSEEIRALLEQKELEFGVWNNLVNDFEEPKKFDEYVEEGRAMAEYKKALVRDIVSQADRVIFEGYEVLAVNYSNASVLVSEIGAELHKKCPPLGIIWAERADIIKVSLRSNDSVDVAEISKKYGGGGHKAAAGFKLPSGSELPWKYLK